MDEENPKWLDADYDDSHKAEVEPLFGTGTVSLQDATDGDDDVESNFGSKAGKYGAISSQEGDNDDESGAQESTVITAISSASSKSAAKNGKKNTKVRQIVITESGKPEMPRPNCFLAFFNLLEGLAMITCLALMASQIIPFIVVPFKELGWANACLKVYISLFCVLFVLVEWDMPIGFLRDASFLQTYVSVGIRMGLHSCHAFAWSMANMRFSHDVVLSRLPVLFHRSIFFGRSIFGACSRHDCSCQRSIPC